jgi:carbon storage regulator
MLVLSRQPGQRIRIGEDIYITVVRIGPANVRLGIDAPRELNIVRTEIDRGRDDRRETARP